MMLSVRSIPELSSCHPGTACISKFGTPGSYPESPRLSISSTCEDPPHPSMTRSAVMPLSPSEVNMIRRGREIILVTKTVGPFERRKQAVACSLSKSNIPKQSLKANQGVKSSGWGNTTCWFLETPPCNDYHRLEKLRYV